VLNFINFFRLQIVYCNWQIDNSTTELYKVFLFLMYFSNKKCLNTLYTECCMEMFSVGNIRAVAIRL